jgi:ribosome-associated protein
MEISSKDFRQELVFQSARSSGPGGQNVNKVNSKVELRFDVVNSTLLSAEEKEVILRKLGSRLTLEHVLILTEQSDRSQLKNREKVTAKFYALLEKAFAPAKKRIKTGPTKASIEKRLETKRLQSGIKAGRKSLDL